MDTTHTHRGEKQKTKKILPILEVRSKELITLHEKRLQYEEEYADIHHNLDATPLLCPVDYHPVGETCYAVAFYQALSEYTCFFLHYLLI